MSIHWSPVPAALPHLTTTCIHTASCFPLAAFRHRLRRWTTLTHWMTKMNRLCCSTRSFLSISLQYTKMPHNKLYGQGTQRGQGVYPSGSFLLRERAQFLHFTWEFSPSGFWVTWPSCCPFMMWKWIQAVASTQAFQHTLLGLLNYAHTFPCRQSLQ